MKNILSSTTNVQEQTSIFVEDFDFTNDAINISMELEKSSFNVLKDSRTILYEACIGYDYEYLSEASENIFVRMANIFKEMIKRLIEFVKKAFMFIRSFIGSFDTFIKSNKEALSKLNPSFDVTGFKYTFDTQSPDTSMINDLINDFNTKLGKLEEMKLSDVGDERKNKFDGKSKEEVRGTIMGTRDRVEAEDFMKTLKSIYRDGATEKSTIKIDKSELNKYISDYPRLKDEIKKVNSESTKIQSILSKLEKFFQSGSSINYNKNTKSIVTNNITRDDDKLRYETRTSNYDTENLKKVNMFYDIKFEEAKFMSNIMMNCYTEKINAMKESLQLYREVIRRALFKKDKGGED